MEKKGNKRSKQYSKNLSVLKLQMLYKRICSLDQRSLEMSEVF